jgi:hypothetical protein
LIRRIIAAPRRRWRDLIRNTHESEACPRSVRADTDDVRRLAEIILVCCAIGGVTRASAQPAVENAAEPQRQAAPIEDNLTGNAAAAPFATPSSAAPHRSLERYGGIPAPESTRDALKHPRLRLEKPIGEITMRVVKNNNSNGAEGGGTCEIQILHDQPERAAREVGTLKIDGAPAQRDNLLSLLKRQACEAGANAIIIKSIEKRRLDGVRFDHVEAVALVVGTPKPPVDPSPAPKTITVTPDGPAIPKTINVDPGAQP